MKIQDLYEADNTSVTGVMNTIRAIYTGERPGTNPRLCHAVTAKHIDPNRPDDTVVLFGYGTTVAHSALVSNGNLIDSYPGAKSTALNSDGNLDVVLSTGGTDELEHVFSMSVGDFVESIK